MFYFYATTKFRMYESYCSGKRESRAMVRDREVNKLRQMTNTRFTLCFAWRIELFSLIL